MTRRPLALSTLTASIAALTALGVMPTQAGASVHSPHAKGSKGFSRTRSNPLVYHGGKLLTGSNTYAIWWGTPSAFPSDAQKGIESLLGGFGGSNYLAIADQYLNTTAASTFVTSLFDTSAPPATSPSTATIVNEVAKVLSASNIAPDPDAIYLVYTSNFPRVNFCAWHSAGTIGATTVQVGYLPNSSGVAGCDPGNLYNSNSYSEGTRSLADSTAHEFMESTTDPVPLSGWADKNGQEIGDKCNFTYSSTVTLANGSKWQLQEEWSNAAGGCVQGS